MSSVKCLATLYLLIMPPDGTAILSRPFRRPASTLALHLGEVCSVAARRVLAFVRAQLGQFGIAAGDQPLAGIVGRACFEEVRSSNRLQLQGLSSIRARMATLLSAAIQLTPFWSRASTAFCEIMPRSATITK